MVDAHCLRARAGTHLIFFSGIGVVVTQFVRAKPDNRWVVNSGQNPQKIRYSRQLRRYSQRQLIKPKSKNIIYFGFESKSRKAEKTQKSLKNENSLNLNVWYRCYLHFGNPQQGGVSLRSMHHGISNRMNILKNAYTCFAKQKNSLQISQHHVTEIKTSYSKTLLVLKRDECKKAKIVENMYTV